MNGMWPQLEPLLARVAEARSLHRAAKTGQQRPDHRLRIEWPGSWSYPDTYEIGLPNQGLQILYEILNERADAVAERTYAPWVDLEALLRAARPAAVLGRHPPAGRRLRRARASTSRPSSSTRTCSTASTSPACPCGPPTAGPSTRSWSPAATAPTTPSRSPTSSTSSCSATARRSSARSPRSSARGRRRAQPTAAASTCCASCATIPGVYVPSMYDVRPTTGGVLVAITPALPRRARRGREAHRRRPRRLAVPEAPARAAHRGRARPPQRRGLPRLHPGLPLLPGRA